MESESVPTEFGAQVIGFEDLRVMMTKASRHVGSKKIGFVSTRFFGTDGVSLETEKWADVLEQMGHSAYYLCGSSDRNQNVTMVVPELDFHHPEIKEINSGVFSNLPRPLETTQRIHKLVAYIKDKIYNFVNHFNIDLLIIENALAIPVNIPLGIALTEFLAETNFDTIAHHHDFYWERQRFLTNSVWDYLHMAFPPATPGVQHVVINSIAANELSRRKGISAWIVPNVMDFHNPPAAPDQYASTIRHDLGIAPDEYFFLQPTRVVQRKGIENAIELIRRTNLKARLVISHASGDEGYQYERRVKEFARLLNVKVNFVSDIISDQRRTTADGRKIYSLHDAYQHADIVTYPSTTEGFGNAFLEAVYFKQPIVVNNYTIYQVDIKPRGFRVIEFNGFITDQTIEDTCRVLENDRLRHSMTERNYTLAKRYYSYSVLKRRLRTILAKIFGEDNHNMYPGIR